MVKGPIGAAPGAGTKTASRGRSQSTVTPPAVTEIAPTPTLPPVRAPGPRSTTSVAVSGSTVMPRVTLPSPRAMATASGPTVPSTIVPRMPMVATGVLIDEPPPRWPRPPDRKRKAPLATEAETELPAGSYTKRSIVSRASAPTVNVDRSSRRICSRLRAPVLTWSASDSRSRMRAACACAAPPLRTWTLLTTAEAMPTWVGAAHTAAGATIASAAAPIRNARGVLIRAIA